MTDYFCELPECDKEIPMRRKPTAINPKGAKMSPAERKLARFCSPHCAGIHKARHCKRSWPKPKKKQPLVKTYAQIVCDNWLYGMVG